MGIVIPSKHFAHMSAHDGDQTDEQVLETLYRCECLSRCSDDDETGRNEVRVLCHENVHLLSLDHSAEHTLLLVKIHHYYIFCYYTLYHLCCHNPYHC